MPSPTGHNTPARCTQADLGDVMRLQKAVYAQQFGEEQESFSSKIAASPETCFIIRDGVDLSAYLITLPCTIDTLPILNAASFAVPENADIFYIHDLAVSPNAAGKGYGTTLVKHALGVASELGLNTACLVAVQNSSGFWAKFGFNAAESLESAIRNKLALYGEGAVFMTRQLGSSARASDFERLAFPS